MQSRQGFCNKSQSIKMQLGLTGKYQYLCKRGKPKVFTLSTKMVWKSKLKYGVRDLIQFLVGFLFCLSFSIAQFIYSVTCHLLLIRQVGHVVHHENQAYEGYWGTMRRGLKFLLRTRYWKVISLKNHRERNLYGYISALIETSLL